MEKTTPARPSEEVMWAGPSGERWLANALQMEATLKPIGEELIARATLAPGDHVVEIGCGAGGMAMEMAGRVAPGGTITGIDISPALVRDATRRAGDLPHGGAVRFVCADAARSGLPAESADCLVSRLGAMFFSDPQDAFTRLRTLLRGGGRMVLAVWAELEKNPWHHGMRELIGRHFEMPVVPARAPGPFAFHEPAYLRDILERAGFSRIDISPWEARMPVGGPGTTPDSAADFMLRSMGFAQRVLDAPPEVRQRVREELIGRLTPFATAEGVRMPAAVWFAQARA